MSIYDKLKTELSKILEENGLSKESIIINSKTLTAEEAIGITERKDFPILTGKEIMLEAEFRGAIGQAFTSSPTVFKGTLEEIVNLDLETDDHAKGLFIASLNAIMKYLKLTDRTIHCRNDGPELCGKKFKEHLKEEYADAKIALIGYQPSILENLSKDFNVRILDLSPENIGKEKFGIKVEHGIDDYNEVVLDWADLVLCTGSTIANGSIVHFLDLDKPVIFYGTTIAGPADILGLQRLCFETE